MDMESRILSELSIVHVSTFAKSEPGTYLTRDQALTRACEHPFLNALFQAYGGVGVLGGRSNDKHRLCIPVQTAILVALSGCEEPVYLAFQKQNNFGKAMDSPLLAETGCVKSQSYISQWSSVHGVAKPTENCVFLNLSFADTVEAPGDPTAWATAVIAALVGKN